MSPELPENLMRPRNKKFAIAMMVLGLVAVVATGIASRQLLAMVEPFGGVDATFE